MYFNVICMFLWSILSCLVSELCYTNKLALPYHTAFLPRCPSAVCILAKSQWNYTGVLVIGYPELHNRYSRIWWAVSFEGEQRTTEGLIQTKQNLTTEQSVKEMNPKAFLWMRILLKSLLDTLYRCFWLLMFSWKYIFFTQVLTATTALPSASVNDHINNFNHNCHLRAEMQEPKCRKWQAGRSMDECLFKWGWNRQTQQTTQ